MKQQHKQKTGLQGSERKTAVVQDQFLSVGASHGWVDAAKRDGNASCL
jgi:hypothetical protein